jgi:hypothetical protein
MSKVINDIAAKHQTSISQLSKKYVSCSPHLPSSALGTLGVTLT